MGICSLFKYLYHVPSTIHHSLLPLILIYAPYPNLPTVTPPWKNETQAIEPYTLSTIATPTRP